ncbi:MAG: hypothetical protein KGH64_02415 [Candidatus Micrarchaeota archaeon]|nr:hypothetical protein [Candidatus Micrarchaeota archaeon]MDE1834168.1 hypothetical protein [Candidatus Micrarchaeota archaeon]MDE1858977.1 hypothetical protein [Candidatus Micrarchaeota archaeon]
MAKSKKQEGIKYILYAVLLLSFVAILYLSQQISAILNVATGVEVVIASVIMAFATYALAKIYG